MKNIEDKFIPQRVKSHAGQSPDKVSGLPRLFLWQAKLFLAQLDALHQEGHITRQRPHGLHALKKLFLTNKGCPKYGGFPFRTFSWHIPA